MKIIKHNFEYALLIMMIGVFAALDPKKSSDLAGKIGRAIGPKLGASKIAMSNLKMALPGKSDGAYKDIISGMWDNFARIISEYQYLETFPAHVEIAGIEHLKSSLESKGQVILFSGHLGNWEIMAATLMFFNVPVDLVYRAPNNPKADRLLNKYRSLHGKLFTIPKSRSGTRKLVERLNAGSSAGILIDQKYNEGIEAPFFGHSAMTSPAFIQLGQKNDIPVVPFRVERLDGIKFRLSFYPALTLKTATGENRPQLDVIADAHALLEQWIVERPEQWLWMHRRWGGTTADTIRNTTEPLIEDQQKPAA